MRLDSAGRARRLFAGCRDLQLVHARFPRRTDQRGGFSVLLFNRVVAPLFDVLPRRLVRPLGYYLIVLGRKPLARGET